MDITYGCVFIEIAKKNGTNSYDWVNKQIFPLSSDSLDSLIYVLSNKGQPNIFVNKNTSDFMFTFSDSGRWTLSNESNSLEDSLHDYQVNGLRILLEQAKIKIHGWN